MRFDVIVPDPIRDEIRSWNLGFEIEDALYEHLQASLEYGHETVCFRLAAPSPTYVFRFSLPDPLGSWVTHHFTFYLTYGPQEDGLYVMQSDYEKKEGPETEEDENPD